MIEILIDQLAKVINKNGQTVYQTTFGDTIIEVRPRPDYPNEFDLWCIAGEVQIDP